MNRRIYVAVWFWGGSDMTHVLGFMSRNLRVALAGAIVAGCVGTAGVIGWMTAPI